MLRLSGTQLYSQLATVFFFEKILKTEEADLFFSERSYFPRFQGDLPSSIFILVLPYNLAWPGISFLGTPCGIYLQDKLFLQMSPLSLSARKLNIT